MTAPPTEYGDLIEAAAAVGPGTRAAASAASAAASTRTRRTAAPVSADAGELGELLDATLHIERSVAWPGVRARARRMLRVATPPLLAAVLVLLAWEAWIEWREVPAYLVPAPSAIAAALAADLARYATAARTSLIEALGGLLLGTSAAFALAVVMAHSRPLERALYPIALLVKVTPVVAVAPLFIIWFGFGALPKMLVAALITFFPMLVNAVTGLRSVDPAAQDFMRTLHASPLLLFWLLRLPASLPYVFAALRISVPLCLIGAVVAEWMAGDGGIGQVILIANGDLDTAALFAAVVVLAIMAVGLTALLALLERRLLFWHESSERM